MNIHLPFYIFPLSPRNAYRRFGRPRVFKFKLKNSVSYVTFYFICYKSEFISFA